MDSRLSGRRRWAVALLALYAAAVIAVLLAPVSPAQAVNTLTVWIQEDLGLEFVRQGWVEFTANVLMFVPLGVLVPLVFRRLWIGVLVAAALSAGAELVQILLPARHASMRDVLANVLGALLGAAIVWAVTRRRPSRGSRAAGS